MLLNLVLVKFLAGLIKRIVPDLKVSSMNTPEDLDKF